LAVEKIILSRQVIRILVVTPVLWGMTYGSPKPKFSPRPGMGRLGSRCPPRNAVARSLGSLLNAIAVPILWMLEIDIVRVIGGVTTQPNKEADTV
jgi:hypothetical protein